MNLFVILLSFISGILVFRHPLFLLLSLALILLKWHDKALLRVIIGFAIFGFLTILIRDLIMKIPFTKGYGLVTNSGKNYFIVLTINGKLYVENKLNSLVPGDIVFVEGYKAPHLFKTIEGDFNYKDYLLNKGIMHSFRVSNIDVKARSILRVFRLFDIGAVNYPSYLSGIKDLLLTKSINYDDPFLQDMMRFDLLFLITLTGAHLSLLRRLSRSILRIFVKDETADFVSYLVLVPLFLFHITKFAFYRIFLTGLFRLINKKKLKSLFSYFEVNVFVAFCFLLLNPWFLFEASFYIAYLLIFSFILIKPKKGLRGLISRYIILFSVLLPYQILSTGIINLSLLFVPLFISPIITIWYVIYLITFSFSFLQNMGVTILNVVYHVMNIFNKQGFMIYFADFNILTILIIVVFCVLFIFAYKIKNIPIYRVSIFGFIYVLLLTFIPLKAHLSASVTFINVGQGDSILFNIYGRSVLIDTGGILGRDIATEILIPYFRRRNIYTLDYLVITHDDFDHSAGKTSLIENFKVRNLITKHQQFPLTIKGVSFLSLNEGGDDENDDSLIVYVSLPCLNILLMGDASVKKEEELLTHHPDLAVDILKIGHHGSNTSTSEDFIRHYQPKRAIISVGHLNKYGHPHKSVLDTLIKYNIEILRTDYHGTISLNSCII